MPALPTPRCPRCLESLPEGAVCPCLAGPGFFAAAHAAGAHGPPLSTAIHVLKYRRRTVLTHPLAELAVAALPPTLVAARPTIVPVPAHPRRRRSRGVDVPLEMAEAVAELIEAPIAPRALRRSVDTPPQVGLSRAARDRNVAGAFRVGAPRWQPASGAAILLVDDVMTTGATAEACARVLEVAGADRVDVLTLSRATLPRRLRDPAPTL